MSGILRCLTDDIFYDIWEICVKSYIKLAYTELFGTHSILFFDDVEFLTVIGMLQYALSEGIVTIHWL